MRICVLFGGFHKKGNTATLLGHFLDGAKASGHSVERFDVAFMQIKPCLGCMHCKQKQDGCAQKDDMELIYEALQRCDCLVLASPMYWWNITGPLKNVVDRFFALPFNAQIQSVFAEKKFLLIMTSGQPKERDGREGVELVFKNMCSFTGMEWIGSFSTGTNEKPVHEQKDVCKQIYDLGASL